LPSISAFGARLEKDNAYADLARRGGFENAKRADPEIRLQSRVSFRLGSRIIFTAGPGHLRDFAARLSERAPTQRSEAVEAAVFGLRGGLIVLLGEHDMIDANVDLDAFAGGTARPVDFTDRLTWKATIFYAHGWRRLRLGIGMQFFSFLKTDSGHQFPIPMIDIWWRFWAI
jgi:hypothetical protein